jgi:hypothetical protein
MTMWSRCRLTRPTNDQTGLSNATPRRHHFSQLGNQKLGQTNQALHAPTIRRRAQIVSGVGRQANGTVTDIGFVPSIVATPMNVATGLGTPIGLATGMITAMRDATTTPLFVGTVIRTLGRDTSPQSRHEVMSPLPSQTPLASRLRAY